jgi:hypothetical protein
MPVAMPKLPVNKLSLEWIAAPDGMALFFDKATWKVFNLNPAVDGWQNRRIHASAMG